MPSSASRSRGRAGAALAIAALAAGMLAGFTLLFGLAATGGGHGTYWLWYTGLALSVLTWLLLLSAVAAAILDWSRGFSPKWWFGFVVLFFVAASAVGFWGLFG